MGLISAAEAPTAAPQGVPAPLFRLVRDDDYFRLLEITHPEAAGGEVRKSFPSLGEAYRRWQALTGRKSVPCPARCQDACFTFYTAWLIIAAAEQEQRPTVKAITSTGTRNIVIRAGTARSYLTDSITTAVSTQHRAAAPNSARDELKKRVKEHLKMNNFTPANLDQLIRKAFAAVKRDLNFPEVNPVEYSCKVTSRVVAAATTEPCRLYLESLMNRDALFPADLAEVRQELERRFAANNEAGAVLAALDATRSRDHIAACSVTTERDQTLLGLANIHRQYLRMESWQFLALLERAGESLRLAELVKTTKPGEPPPLLIFNSNKEGLVVAKYDPQRSVLEVACLADGTHDIRDKATFILDSTYTLCLYAALKRLADDREEFRRRREDAQTLVATRDPFDFVYRPLTTP